MQWTVVVPVKPAAVAKSRLGLGPQLARAIALDTVAAAVACPLVSRVIVVTADPAFRPPDAEVVAETAPAGIDAAVRAGASLAAGGPLAALLGDLPALRPVDLAEALTLAAAHPRAFVADREGVGTTLVTALEAPLITAFGDGSARRHRELGLAPLTPRPASTIEVDVDTVEQLAVATALGLGPATSTAARAAEEGRG